MSVYLSPSTQQYNTYYDGVGNEEYYMNLIADEMQQLLTEAGIETHRNSTGFTASQSATDSNNSGNHQLHLALHSNAAAPQNAGNQQGTDVYYYASSVRGKEAAEIIADYMRNIYPFDAGVKTVPNTTFVELNRTRAPAVLIEIAYHDNPEDAEWIRNNITLIAETLVAAVEAYLNQVNNAFVPVDGLSSSKSAIPADVSSEAKGTVSTGGGRLNIRNQPSMSAAIIGQIPNGAIIPIYSTIGKWTLTRYNDIEGYVYSEYVIT